MIVSVDINPASALCPAATPLHLMTSSPPTTNHPCSVSPGLPLYSCSFIMWPFTTSTQAINWLFFWPQMGRTTCGRQKQQQPRRSTSSHEQECQSVPVWKSKALLCCCTGRRLPRPVAFEWTLASFYLKVYSHSGNVCSAPCILCIVLLFFHAVLPCLRSREHPTQKNLAGVSKCIGIYILQPV